MDYTERFNKAIDDLKDLSDEERVVYDRVKSIIAKNGLSYIQTKKVLHVVDETLFGYCLMQPFKN